MDPDENLLQRGMWMVVPSEFRIAGLLRLGQVIAEFFGLDEACLTFRAPVWLVVSDYMLTDAINC